MFHQRVGDCTVGEYLFAYGVLTRNDLRSACLALRSTAMRANALTLHNARAAENRSHVAHTVQTVRASCYRCQKIGDLHHRTVWYAARCHANHMVESANSALTQEATLASQRAVLVNRLKRTLPLVCLNCLDPPDSQGQ